MGAGMDDVAVGYVIAGDLGAGPKSPQYGLLKRGELDEKEGKKLRKCGPVRDPLITYSQMMHAADELVDISARWRLSGCQ